MTKLKLLIAGVILASLLMTGCTGFNAFSLAGRPGDTISLAVGWNQNLTRDQLTVTITPSSGSPVDYLPGDPAVRALVNMYPDPLSRIIVEREVGTPADDGWLFGLLMENTVTGPDKDFFQKLLIMDLPAGIATGPATISFSSTGGEVIAPLTVDILPGVGISHRFDIQEGLAVSLGSQIDLGERVPHHVVSFSGAEVPHAIQVDFTHDPGNPYVVSPRGSDIKSANWTDDGSNLRVILLPVNSSLTDLVNFKFYVAGDLQNLQLAPAGVSAFDIDGNEIVGINATITPNL